MSESSDPTKQKLFELTPEQQFKRAVWDSYIRAVPESMELVNWSTAGVGAATVALLGKLDVLLKVLPAGSIRWAVCFSTLSVALGVLSRLVSQAIRVSKEGATHLEDYFNTDAGRLAVIAAAQNLPKVMAELSQPLSGPIRLFAWIGSTRMKKDGLSVDRLRVRLFCFLTLCNWLHYLTAVTGLCVLVLGVPSTVPEQLPEKSSKPVAAAPTPISKPGTNTAAPIFKPATNTAAP